MGTPDPGVGNFPQRRTPESAWLAAVGVAAAAAGGGLLLLPGLLAHAFSRGTGLASRAASLAVLAGALLLFAVVCVAALTVAGGAIALRRHRLELRGYPYPSHGHREWRPGFLVRTVHGRLRSVGAWLTGSQARRAFFPRDEVEVRSFEEIRTTLDSQGSLDALPFVPEMAAFCGRCFRVFRRVDKVHDYVTHTGLRRLRDTVLLDGLRCDGRYHGGCQACCHLLWKEAWLKPAEARRGALGWPDAAVQDTQAPGFAVPADGVPGRGARVDGHGQISYACQMTEVVRASSPMSWNDPRHYLRDLFLGNVRLVPFLVGVSIEMFNRVQRRFGNGVVYPVIATSGRPTSPHEVLDLRPGDCVRVRTKHEIERTLTAGFRNRGLWFDAEMLRFCGGEYRVATRVQVLIEEKTGKLVNLSTPCIILEGVTASGEYLAFCPQNESILWREIWLERVFPAPRG